MAKYIVQFGQAVVFGNATSHAEAAGGRPVESAGFCEVVISDERKYVFCYGKSVSTKIESAIGDAAKVAYCFSDSLSDWTVRDEKGTTRTF